VRQAKRVTGSRLMSDAVKAPRPRVVAECPSGEVAATQVKEKQRDRSLKEEESVSYIGSYGALLRLDHPRVFTFRNRYY
jgi:hypothetical protein